MTASCHIAVIDIGKTNVKLALVDLSALAEIDISTQPNRVLPGPPWPHFDVEGQWAFLVDELARMHNVHRIDAIVTTTHGAAAALLDVAGKLAAPVLDYEFSGPEETAANYDKLRPGFAETGSPRLPLGLNLGAQLHWQFATDPGLLARTSRIVTYPQYWGFRLTGVAATDLTSLGCHTDLWAPHPGHFSMLVERLRIEDKLAPARAPSDILGPVLPDVAAMTGLDPNTPVYCGIHDSNASLLPYLQTREPPFAVVSTGTWVIAMAVGGRQVALDEARDTLINVNAFGAPVPSARFMGGREYELLGAPAPATQEGIADALTRPVLLLPAVAPESGPFRGRTMRWSVAESDLPPATRAAAVAFYLALMTAECVALTGAKGPIMVEGPFTANIAFLQMLGAATGQQVLCSKSRTGTSVGAALLVAQSIDPAARPTSGPAPTANSARFRSYAEHWRQHL